ncbi:unnamed protein product, partial [Ectocarpus sp. 8 AP-2014]
MANRVCGGVLLCFSCLSGETIDHASSIGRSIVPPQDRSPMVNRSLLLCKGRLSQKVGVLYHGGMQRDSRPQACQEKVNEDLGLSDECVEAAGWRTSPRCVLSAERDGEGRLVDLCHVVLARRKLFAYGERGRPGLSSLAARIILQLGPRVDGGAARSVPP